MNTALMITKEVVKAASNYGIGYMAGEVCKALTPENVSTAKKVCMLVGSTAAAGYVGLKAGEYIDEVAETIDETVKAIKALREEKKSTITNKKEEEKIKAEKEEKKEKKPKKKEDKKTKETKVEETEEA